MNAGVPQEARLPAVSELELKRFVAKAIWDTCDEEAGSQVTGAEVAQVAPIYARMFTRQLPGYRVDMEYDREGTAGRFKGGERDQAGNWANWVRPDIIIHRRGVNDANLLVLEFKLERDDPADCHKIRRLMGRPLAYSYGASVVLKPEPRWRWFTQQSVSTCQDPPLEPVPRPAPPIP